MALKLYDEAGWLNIPALAAVGMPFNIIIGPRQCGKTYGCLKDRIYSGDKFVFMRRTPTELDTCLKGSTSTFQSLSMDLGFAYQPENESQYIRRVDFYNNVLEEKPFNDCLALALTSVSKIRGFSGRPYTDLVYDEFIPEVTAKRMKGEGDAFINAYVTINGNRELFGEPPLRCWLLANSNDLFSPILAEMGLTSKIESMVKRDQEYAILEEKGVLIVRPRSNDIMEKRKKTALYRLTGTETQAAQMALGNKFAYNDISDISSVPLDEYNCIMEIGMRYVWVDKATKSRFYVCQKKAGSPVNVSNNSTRGMNSKIAELGWAHFIDAVYRGEVIFSDYSTKRFIYYCFNKPLF